MKIGKSFSFNRYGFPAEFSLLIIFCFLMICCESRQTQKVLTPESGKLFSENAVNINAVSAQELEKLPSIGEKTAQNIIEHRQKYGNFRKPEHLILVRGISDKKFRQMKNLVKTE